MMRARLANLISMALPAHDRRLIPDGRFAGTMPWVMAIMLFLTILSAAAALSFISAAGQGRSQLAREATVQILSADPAQRMREQQHVTTLLRREPGIDAVVPVPAKEARALLEPWLGASAADADIPVPAMIDIQFDRPPSAAALAALRKKLKNQAEALRIDSNAGWMQPFFDLLQSLLLLALAVVVLLLLATAATVALSVRGALNTHRSTIEIMHMMGATDMQAARLFQRRVALDAVFGGVVGFGAAILVLLLLRARTAALAPALLADGGFPLWGWPVLAAIPLGVTGLTMVMARWTVLSVLKRML